MPFLFLSFSISIRFVVFFIRQAYARLLLKILCANKHTNSYIRWQSLCTNLIFLFFLSVYGSLSLPSFLCFSSLLLPWLLFQTNLWFLFFRLFRHSHSRTSRKAEKLSKKFVFLWDDRLCVNQQHVCVCFFVPRSFQMFSEPPSSSVSSVLSTSISPLSSEYVSPVSSASHSRTSTITSTSFHRNDASSSSSAYLTGNSSQRQMKIGKYFLERTIGKGNFAVVKLATHCDTHQKVIEIERKI